MCEAQHKDDYYNNLADNRQGDPSPHPDVNKLLLEATLNTTENPGSFDALKASFIIQKVLGAG